MATQGPSDLRKERIGIAHAAAVLGVGISELREAYVHQRLLRGHPVPKPVVGRSGDGRTTHPFWYLGDVMDLAERMKEGSRDY